jgi:hypothetical protein
METVEFFANRVCDSLIATLPPWFDGRRTFLLDGTTITLTPTRELKQAFPPATNQHGESVWPVALLLVAHELQSSFALPPEIGAMYGENNTSEAKLARRIAQWMPRGSIAMADSAYGIFSVAHTMVQEGHSILFRLTKSRFKSLKRQATLVEEWDGHATWRLRWTPRPQDQPRSSRRCRDRRAVARSSPGRRDAATGHNVAGFVRASGRILFTALRCGTRHPGRESHAGHGEHSREKRVDGEEGTADVDRGLQPGGSVPPPDWPTFRHAT